MTDGEQRALSSEIRQLRRRLETTEGAMLRAETLKSAYDGQRRQLNQMAAAVQRYLPSSYPEMGGLLVAGSCRPCADLGGDFFDAVELRDGRIAVTMADVSGHGAVAAILMASSRALLRASLAEISPSEGPAAVMYRLARWLSSEFLETEFVTMWLGIYDRDAGTLRYAAAAHPTAIIWRRGEPDPVYLHSENGIPLGLAGLDPERPPEHEIEFREGDRLFLYTDGWTESPSRDGVLLEGPALLDLFANSAGQTVDMVPLMLFTELDRHLADSRIRDDISLLVVDRLL